MIRSIKIYIKKEITADLFKSLKKTLENSRVFNYTQVMLLYVNIDIIYKNSVF